MNVVKSFLVGAVSGLVLAAVAILAVEQSGRILREPGIVDALIDRAESLMYLISTILGGLIKVSGMIFPKEVAGNKREVSRPYSNSLSQSSFIERGAVTSSAAYAFSAAMLYALGHIVASGFQGFVFSLLSTEELSTSWLVGSLSPVYTSCLFGMTLLIPYLHFRSYTLECRDRGLVPSFHAALLIGPGSILLVGISAFVGLSPNQFIVLSLDPSLQMPPGFGISHLVYQALLRFVIFPLVALVACVSARRAYRQKQLV